MITLNDSHLILHVLNLKIMSIYITDVDIVHYNCTNKMWK